MGWSKRFAALMVLLLACCAASARGERWDSPQKIAGLGTATFPTTTDSRVAQTDFMHGLLLLHVFEYEDAAKWFEKAEQADPRFAMAYWGEAMTFNHPVWDELDAKAGQAALTKFGPTPAARQARMKDPRERAYVAAVEILYSGEATKSGRDAEYAKAMQKLSEKYPHDDEAQLFYALALLGRSEGVRDVPTYLKAAAIAKTVFMRNPDHPGAAHYWIHGMDDPQHAAGALTAAEALSKIAPDAAHAQHMCSHIFMALGMWNAVVKANENAMRVVDTGQRAAGQPVYDCGHYDKWLEYGYFQQGRIADANRVLEGCVSTGEAAQAWMQAHPGQALLYFHTAEALQGATNRSLVSMRGIALVETGDWTGRAKQLQVDSAGLQQVEGWNVFVSGYAEAESGDPAGAAASLARLKNLAAQSAAARYKAEPSADKEDVMYLGILTDELSGLMASNGGDIKAAIAEVQRAAAKYDGMPVDFGPPVPMKPPNELLGELLLKDGKAAAARAAFERSLERAPKRTQSLLGLARAERALGDMAASQATYRELAAIWKNADAGYAPAAEARRYAGPVSAAKRSAT
jgi:tetratricopeptide (TPR) repeat protein